MYKEMNHKHFCSSSVNDDSLDSRSVPFEKMILNGFLRLDPSNNGLSREEMVVLSSGCPTGETNESFSPLVGFVTLRKSPVENEAAIQHVPKPIRVQRRTIR